MDLEPVRMINRRVAIGLIALAVFVRAGAVLVLQSHMVPHSTFEHGEIAANLLAGRGFSVRFLGADGPTSQQAPTYPLLVAAAYVIGGVGTPRALLVLELSQALLGGVMVFGVLALGREVAPHRPVVAILAGLIAALHPTLVYAATHVQVASVAAALLVGSLALAHRTGRTGRNRDAMWCGVVFGVLVLTDPILALAAPALAWAIVVGRTHPSQPPLSTGGSQTGEPAAWKGEDSSLQLPHLIRGNWWRCVPAPVAVILRLLSVIVGVVALALAPWLARNAAVHGELVFIKSTFGYAFWQGNCALSEGTDKVVRPSVERVLQHRGRGLRALNAALWAARHEAGYLDDIALTSADYRELAVLSEPQRSRLLFRRALKELAAAPGRYAALSLSRLRFFVLFDETNPKTRNPVYRFSHLGLTFLSFMAWPLMGPKLRWRLLPSAITVVLVALFHTLTIVSARFHIPLEPILDLWAGAGLASWHRLAWRGETSALTRNPRPVGICRARTGALPDPSDRPVLRGPNSVCE
jgi:hypothetical protein